MHVYIMRHGDAALEAASDAQRPLTHCGRNETQQMAHWLAAHGPNIQQVFTSPYLRAQQTCQIALESIGTSSLGITLDTLAPDGDAREVADLLHGLALTGVESVLLVSHLPLVGYMVSELCPEEAPPMFATAGIACIDYRPEQHQGELNWQVSPSKLAKAM